MKLKNPNIDLTPNLVASMANHPRKRGRYSASELFFIFYGVGRLRTTPEKWLKPTDKELDAMFKMWDGNVIHHAVQELLRRGYKEEKREYKCDFGGILVAKADYLPDERDGVPEEDEVWEFKSSEKLMEKAKEWHIYQTKLYCSMFGKRVGKIFQPVRKGNKTIHLKLIGTVARDDEWFLEEIAKLYDFHMRVEELCELKNK